MKRLRTALFVLATLLAACGGSSDGTDAPSTTAAPTADPNNTAVQAVQRDLAERLQADPADINVVSATIGDWPDSCLGAPTTADETCAQVETPGYEIVATYLGNTYTYRTDKTGNDVRFAGVDVGSNDATPRP